MVLVSNEGIVSSFRAVISKIEEGYCRHKRAITATIICCLILLAVVAVGLIISAAIISIPSLLTAGIFLLAIDFTGMAIVAIKLVSKLETEIKIKSPLLKKVDSKIFEIP